MLLWCFYSPISVIVVYKMCFNLFMGLIVSKRFRSLDCTLAKSRCSFIQLLLLITVDQGSLCFYEFSCWFVIGAADAVCSGTNWELVSRTTKSFCSKSLEKSANFDNHCEPVNALGLLHATTCNFSLDNFCSQPQTVIQDQYKNQSVCWCDLGTIFASWYFCQVSTNM